MDKYLDKLDHQDWKTIIVKPNKENIKSSSKKVDNITLKKISVEKKADNDDLHHKILSIELRQSIQKARCFKSLTQKQLAISVNLSQQIISDIESGKAIYDHQHINKIKRFLKLK